MNEAGLGSPGDPRSITLQSPEHVRVLEEDRTERLVVPAQSDERLSAKEERGSDQRPDLLRPLRSLPVGSPGQRAPEVGVERALQSAGLDGLAVRLEEGGSRRGEVGMGYQRLHEEMQPGRVRDRDVIVNDGDEFAAAHRNPPVHGLCETMAGLPPQYPMRSL